MPPTVTGECEDTRAAWGEVCKTCGQRLPTALPWGYGRPCTKPLEFPSGSSAGLGEREMSQSREPRQVVPGQGIRIMPRTPVGGWDTQL